MAAATLLKPAAKDLTLYQSSMIFLKDSVIDFSILVFFCKHSRYTGQQG